MSAVLKKITAPLVFASFLMVTFLGFAAMSNGPDGRMQGDCPFSTAGTSLCPQDAFASALHHLAAYQSFISAPVGLSLSELLIVLFSLCAISILAVRLWVLIPHQESALLYTSPPPVLYNKKLTRWLALFENSPSFY